jgi:hypothetical protein
VASKYVNRAALDDDTTIPDDAVVDGVTTGHDTHHPNAHSAIRILETYLGIAGGSPTTSPPGSGQVLLSTSAGQSDWAAPPVGTPSSTVVADDYTTASTAGVATPYSRGDHKHKSDRPILPFVWTVDTVTSPLDLQYNLVVPFNADLYSLTLSLKNVATTGANTKVDLKVGGTTRLSTQPEIVVGQTVNTVATVFSSTALTGGTSVITTHVTQGSSGGPLTILLLVQLTVPA